MLKDITFDQAAMDRLKEGVAKLTKVVKSTLGPGGTNVILERGDTQAITKDGVSVAREIFLEDSLENIGAQIVKEAASRTGREAGDGTTTATVLAEAILLEGIRNIAAGGKPMDLKRGIDMAVKAVVSQIKAMSSPVDNLEDITKVALISANGDQEMGSLIGKAVHSVGKEGIVTVEDGKGLTTEWKQVEGMRFDRGFMSPYFINTDSGECILENPLVIIYNGNLMSLREMVSPEGNRLLDRISKTHGYQGKPLLMISIDYSAEAIATMARNVASGAIQACMVQAPEFGDIRREVMKDIAALVGAKIIETEAGLNLENAPLEVIGRCERVRINQWSTTIVQKNDKSLILQNRIAQINEQMEQANEYALEVLKQRMARLVNGLGVIYVGGSSLIEVQEKKDRIDDALSATKAALQEGIIPGGGVGYIRAMQAIDWNALPVENKDQQTGVEIIKAILPVPFKAIVSNVGENGDVVLDKILDKPASFGYNAKTMKYADLLEDGVIDPTKVSRLALENAASVAGMLLTINAVVSHKRNK